MPPPPYRNGTRTEAERTGNLSGLLILIIKSKGLLILIIIISKPLEHNLNNSTRRIICTVHRKGLGIGGLTN